MTVDKLRKLHILLCNSKRDKLDILAAAATASRRKTVKGNNLYQGIHLEVDG